MSAINEKLKVGDKLYKLNVGNMARYQKQKLTPVFVKKVGRKYFTVGEKDGSRYSDIQFYIDDWYEKTNYFANWILYKSKQDYYNEIEASKICRNIDGAFKYGKNCLNISLEDLRVVENIINKYL